MPQNYSIHFSIETTSDKLQKICDDLLSDLQSHTANDTSVVEASVAATPIQLNHYPIDEDEQNVSVEVEILNLNQKTLDYLVERIKTGEFDSNFQEYKVYNSTFDANEQAGLFTYLLDKMKDEFHIVPTNK